MEFVPGFHYSHSERGRDQSLHLSLSLSFFFFFKAKPYPPNRAGPQTSVSGEDIHFLILQSPKCEFTK